MKKQVIAIVFSDLHLNLWAKFNEDNKEPESFQGFVDYTREM